MKRAAVYVRVSSDEQAQGHSLSAQQFAAEQFAASHGWEIVRTYRDEGISARYDDIAKRPAFKQMLDDAKARHFDTIIVHKLDRFARNRQVAFNTFSDLAKHGVGFISIAENMDYSSPAGQLMLTMLVGMSQFYSDNLSWETKKGKAERKRSGRYNGLLPFGVRKDAQGIPVLDMEVRSCHVPTRQDVRAGDGLRLAFALAADGLSDRDVARRLNDHGYVTSGNRGTNPLTKDSVRVILRNRFYLGELPDGHGDWLPGRHEGMVDPVLFERAQRQRSQAARRSYYRPVRRVPWALSGIAVCGLCGKPMILRGNPGKIRYVGCAGRKDGLGCPARYAPIVPIVDQMRGLLTRFHVESANEERLLNAWRYRQSRNVPAVASRRSLERKMARLKDLYVEGELTKEEYQIRRQDIVHALATLPDNTDPSSGSGKRTLACLRNLAEEWPNASSSRQNAICRKLFQSVVIHDGRAEDIVPQPFLEPFFGALGTSIVSYSGSDGGRSRRCVISHPARLSSLIYRNVIR